MNMEQPRQDPLQEKFTNKLKDGGVEFAQENKNRFLTPEEWFARYYQGQTDQELPARVIEETSPEELLALKEKYGSKDQPKAEQTTLDL
jgi:hypothetical protein